MTTLKAPVPFDADNLTYPQFCSLVEYDRLGAFNVIEPKCSLTYANEYAGELGARAISNPRIPCQPDYLNVWEVDGILIYAVWQ